MNYSSTVCVCVRFAIKLRDNFSMGHTLLAMNQLSRGMASLARTPCLARRETLAIYFPVRAAVKPVFRYLLQRRLSKVR